MGSMFDGRPAPLSTHGSRHDDQAHDARPTRSRINFIRHKMPKNLLHKRATRAESTPGAFRIKAETTTCARSPPARARAVPCRRNRRA